MKRVYFLFVELLLLITVVPRLLGLPALPHRPHDDPGVGRVAGTLRYHVARAPDEHKPGPGARVVKVIVGVAHLVVEVILLRHPDSPLDRGLDDAPGAAPLYLPDVCEAAPVTSAASATASTAPPHTPRGRGKRVWAAAARCGGHAASLVPRLVTEKGLGHLCAGQHGWPDLWRVPCVLGASSVLDSPPGGSSWLSWGAPLVLFSGSKVSISPRILCFLVVFQFLNRTIIKQNGQTLNTELSDAPSHIISIQDTLSRALIRDKNKIFSTFHSYIECRKNDRSLHLFNWAWHRVQFN